MILIHLASRVVSMSTSKKQGWIAVCVLMGVVSLAMPAAAGAHGGGGASDELGNLRERQIRAVETQILGPEHAAEHAAIRARARTQGADTDAATREATAQAQAALVSGPSDQIGQWAAPFPIPIFGINAVMLPTGKVMWWSYPLGPRFNTSQAFLWDPATGREKKVAPPIDSRTGEPANLWCSGQSLLADGRVLVTGGNL